LLKSRSSNFLRETIRFYCISGALRGLGFQNFPVPPEGSHLRRSLTPTPNQKCLRGPWSSYDVTHFFTISWLHARQESPPPSGKFSYTALVTLCHLFHKIKIHIVIFIPFHPVISSQMEHTWHFQHGNHTDTICLIILCVCLESPDGVEMTSTGRKISRILLFIG
jgi:hypothetical protein